MNVLCKINVCKFNKDGVFCGRDYLSITENGLCGTIYDKGGNQRPPHEWVKEEKLREQEVGK